MKKKILSSLFPIIILILCIIVLKAELLNKNINSVDDLRNVAIENRPTISAAAAITLDVTNNKILYKKHIHEKLPPASTTKLLTAQIFAEHFSPEDDVMYTRRCKEQPEYKLNLKVGETMNAKDVMDAVMLYSANDMAEAMGENSNRSLETFNQTTGKNSNESLESFVQAMNEKVSSLGLKESHFMNPIGLDDEEHYTTAYDLVNIAKEAYKYPWIMDTMKKKVSTINTSKGKISLENRNKLVGINGCIGGKTGYTSRAGKCLVCFYEINNRKMIGVVLNSQDDNTVFEDMERIIRWSYKK
ncbi:D-alanyl-D-alanine carboxypeptidase [Clostridium tetanomorphum]|uniref:D-alanyl-D-alanine carboxypeptidase family protein n=1 Tax=Clostridium tetanomorphum TaxID=1553 RepID=UPI000445BC13|nr:D-alanyl-D-alanine carboxypeptidase [Clostridium tetanomorphum]KAJ50551.1 D-alanyl-D-alanine carboxypeptidase [Clostridium tetanomorphum DSM 665]MBP1866529.1 D-alanyl-D-alanine carboxypeptidase [Clostridium tetanomorphum]NRS86526.1 D-alanyl-D-alanine carboxypeptidase [Clostridium tetanomorphum]SQC00953.1 D-alanyl-D-alanine carboxypeptidase [Clostridium tetanomorphum]